LLDVRTWLLAAFLNHWDVLDATRDSVELSEFLSLFVRKISRIAKMTISRIANKDKGTPIHLPDTKRIWVLCFIVGAVFWIIGLVLWGQQGMDKAVLLYYDAMRIANAPIVILSKWLSSYGMATITVLFVVYLLFSRKIKSLDAPLTVYFYTICSFGFSGIAGDLIKEIFARPRPKVIFGSEILVLGQSVTPAIPSGHATKSIALILPFILLVSNSKDLHKVIKIAIALIAGGVCVSRIVLGAHYLSDVLAGFGMALIGLPLSMLFANMVLRKAKQEQLPTLSLIWGFLLIFLTIVFMAL
jgi:membrane-associated phospholipid phosphatase